MEKWKTKSSFPTFPQPLATMTPVLYLKNKDQKKGCRPLRGLPIPYLLSYRRSERISCSSFDWKMLR